MSSAIFTFPFKGESKRSGEGATGMGMVISPGCDEDGKMIINLCLSVLSAAECFFQDYSTLIPASLITLLILAISDFIMAANCSIDAATISAPLFKNRGEFAAASSRKGDDAYGFTRIILS